MAMLGTLGRAGCSITAMAAVPSACFPSLISFARLPTFASTASSYFASSRSLACQLLYYSGPSQRRSFSTSFTALSSSSVSSVETGGQELSTSSPETTSPGPAAVDIDALDIRVGRVLKAWKHPEADSLYVEEVDLAEPEGPRTICSGLVNYLSLEDLEGRAVVVLANLKARNMRGVKSNGMLLAASNTEHTTVQLLSPPEGSAPGERVWFGEEADHSNQSPPGTPNQVQKKKIWEGVQPLLKTTESCVATFQSKPMRTSVGVVTCHSLQGANIS